MLHDEEEPDNSSLSVCLLRQMVGDANIWSDLSATRNAPFIFAIPRGGGVTLQIRRRCFSAELTANSFVAILIWTPIENDREQRRCGVSRLRFAARSADGTSCDSSGGKTNETQRAP